MNIYILFAIIVPVAMFFSGFVVARQIRALQNVPPISLMFVKYKWVFSTLMGICISGIFFLVGLFDTEFSAWSIVAFIVMVLIASASNYFGISLGWGRPAPAHEDVARANQAPINELPENVILDDTLTSVKITINTRKRWVWFAMSLFPLAMFGLCALPVFGLFLIALLQEYLPESMNIVIWFVVGAFVLYVLYARFQDTLEYLFDKEVIEIDNFSVKIENSTSGFKSTKEYAADNIKKITTMFSLGGTNVITKRSPFINSNMPAFMIWHNRGLKRHRTFGRAVDLADAQRILETIYRRFPQYKG